MTPIESALSVLTHLKEHESRALWTLLNVGATITMDTAAGPHVYAAVDTSGRHDRATLRMLGILNGILAPFGSIIVAVYDEDTGELLRFEPRHVEGPY